MADNENFTVKPAATPRPGGLLFLSIARAEKYDLLIHLLTNLQQSLVLVGAEGIGKTTFLEKLQIDQYDEWQICYVNGGVDAKVKHIKAKLLKNLTIRLSNTSDITLVQALTEFEQMHVKVVLLVDDAGELRSELISALFQLAEACPVLRIVFALTPVMLAKISQVDERMEKCHFIEIPVLSKWECAKYLQNLSVNPVNQIDIKRLNSSLVDKIFEETEGVPGKILETIASAAVVTSRISNKIVLFISAILVVFIIVYTVKFGLPEMVIEGDQEVVESTTNTHEEHAIVENQDSVRDNELLGEVNALVLESVSPSSTEINEQIDPDQAQMVSNEFAISNQQSVLINDVAAKVIVDAGQANLVQTEVSDQDEHLVDELAIQKSEVEVSIPDNNPLFDRQWLTDQPDKNYTVQLIVLSDLNKALAFKTKYGHDELPIKLLRTQKKEVIRYVLLTGSFTGFKQAKLAAKNFSPLLNQPWIRAIASIKAELKTVVN